MPESKVRTSRTIIGEVVADKMTKTIVVRVSRLKKHPKYLKYMKRSTRFLAHDEEGKAKMGDIVEICETRPISKKKRWMLVKVIKSGSAIPLLEKEGDAV